MKHVHAEYRCKKCGEEFEKLARFAEADLS
jgi:DNA-directed RNA polymerase subunit RPC12/RpoP